jgi:hypothetical protein
MRLSCLLFALAACNTSASNRVGVLTEENIGSIAPRGDVAGARPGDYFLKNDHAVFIVQRPGRELSLGPYGGTVIDAAVTGGVDHFGELIPTLAAGRTIYVSSIRVISDGSDGEPIEIEAEGRDATNIYYNLEAVMPDLLSYEPDGSGLLGLDPDASLALDVRIRYSLPLDEPRLTIKYTFVNGADRRIGVPFAELVDTRGHVETFVPGPGFSGTFSRNIDQNIFTSLLDLDPSPFMLLAGAAWSLAIIPRRVQDKTPPQAYGVNVPFLGGVVALDAGSAPGVVKDPSFTLWRKGDRAEAEVDVLVGDDPAAVATRAWELAGVPLADVGGCVTSGGSPAAGLRVGLTHAERGTTSFFTTGPDGCWSGHAPAGHYTAIAGRLYFPPSPEAQFDAPGRVTLEVPPPAELAVEVTVHDSLSTPAATPLPCRLTLVGIRQIVSHPALGDAPLDDSGGDRYRIFNLPACRDTIEVAPGHYRAYVTRGPEYDLVDQEIDTTAGSVTRLSGAIHRVVDSDGYAASDFHVHAIFSPDSAVNPLDRVLSLAAEGMDFWASTDHDVVADYTGYIHQLGLEGHLSTMPGSEVTTFDTGHFGAYPLDVQPLTNGGAPDWAPDLGGVRPTFQELFDRIHARGALVQINHPRGGAMSIGAYFTRSGLTFDAARRVGYAEPALQPLPNDLLRYPPGLSFYSDDFDVIEVMNGTSTNVANGMVYDGGVEGVGHDWMSYLSGGKRVIGVANSDTHSLGSLPGEPRTMVGGHHGGVAGLVAALRRGDAVLTTGPMLRAYLVDASGATAGLGETLTPTTSQVTLRVHVETPAWYDVDAVEVIANVFFADTTTGEPAPAVVQAPLQSTLVPRPNGGSARLSQIDIPLDLSAAPFAGGDGWLAVRVGGTTTSVYPALLRAARPYAMSNPIYLDLDGDRRWR